MRYYSLSGVIFEFFGFSQTFKLIRDAHFSTYFELRGLLERKNLRYKRYADLISYKMLLL